MARIFFFAVAFIFIFSNSAQAARRGEHVCGSHKIQSHLMKYCIDFGDRTHNHDILYVLHGSNGTEQDWIEAQDNVDIENAWTESGTPAPTKITISFGVEWMFADVVHSDEALPYQMMVDEVIPFVESKIPGKIGKRFLKGVSMGGWNGVQLLMKNGELFDRVALVCPVIWTLGPFSPRAEVEAYLKRGEDHLNREWVEDLIREEKGMFKTPAEWADHNALELVRHREIKTPKVYLSCGDADEYGFFEGTMKFASMAVRKGVQVTWAPKHGGHCTIDSKELARFFSP